MNAHIRRTLFQMRPREGARKPELLSASSVGAHWTEASNRAKMTAASARAHLDEAVVCRGDVVSCGASRGAGG